MRHGGQILVHQLKIQNCERVFCVPDTNLVPVLDGLYEHAQLQTVTCRQESSAAIMAEAYGRLKGMPGVCFVAHKAGATGAISAITSAQQDGIPLIVFAIYEDDYDCLDVYKPIAKFVSHVKETALIPEMVSRALQVALSGKAGPVVIGLSTAVLRERCHTGDRTPVKVGFPAPALQQIEAFEELLLSSSRPILIVGGSWSQESAGLVQQVSSKFDLPVMAANGCQDYIDNSFAKYAGYIENRDNPKVLDSLEQADLLIGLGINVSNLAKHGSGRIKIPHAEQKLIAIHPDPNELGNRAHTALSIPASSAAFLEVLTKLEAKDSYHWCDWTEKLHNEYLGFIKPTENHQHIDIEYMARVLSDSAPQNSLFCLDKGSYTSMLSRYLQHDFYGKLLTTGSDNSGYALPAAIAAKLCVPEKEVITVTGDAGFIMSSSELSTIMHYGLKVIIIVINNSMSGATRLTQESLYPGRTLGTTLTNPNFKKIAESFQISAQVVEHRKDFRAALKQATKNPQSSIIEYKAKTF